MESFIAELEGIYEHLTEALNLSHESEVVTALEKLETRTEKIDRASCKYWKENHANVYFENFQQPPAEILYLNRHSLAGTYTVSNNRKWKKYSSRKVKEYIEDGIDQLTIEKAAEIAIECEQLFEDKRTEVASLLEISIGHSFSSLLQELLSQTWNLELISAEEIIRDRRPPASAIMLLSDPICWIWHCQQS